jgi:hypothetical protein
VPSKIRPDDWDRLFRPNAPRRGGPLRVLGNIVLTLVLLGLIGGGAVFALDYRNTQVAQITATAIAFRTNVAPGLTATAGPTATFQAQLTATRFTIQTATAAAAQGAPLTATPGPAATPPASLGVGVVTAGGNLRIEPLIADNVVGLIWPGDQVALIERREVDGQVWFRVQLLQPAPNRGGQGVAPGEDGWASATLLSPPTPVPLP